jgi:D-xylose transport system substrate-binding protein
MSTVTSKRHQPLAFIVSLMLFSILLAACTNASNNQATTGNQNNTLTTSNGAGNGCKKIGVLLPDAASKERWETKDRPLLQTDITQALPGVQVDIANADGTAATQQEQAEQALSHGDCILVVAAVDETQAAAIVTNAQQRQVPVIAYDHLIQDKNLKYYVSFDNKLAGELQGQYIANHYQHYKHNGTTNIAIINGTQSNNDTSQLYQGAMSKLNPLLSSNKIKKVYSIAIPEANSTHAYIAMEQALTITQKNIQIAYVTNDDMANAVIAALHDQQRYRKVLVTGAGATVTGIRNILKGNQAITIYKAITKEAEGTAQLVAAISTGKSTTSLTRGDTTKTQDGAAIPSILEAPIIVDQSNIQTTVLADNYLSKEQICRDLPSGTNTHRICG